MSFIGNGHCYCGQCCRSRVTAREVTGEIDVSHQYPTKSRRHVYNIGHLLFACLFFPLGRFSCLLPRETLKSVETQPKWVAHFRFDTTISSTNRRPRNAKRLYLWKKWCKKAANARLFLQLGILRVRAAFQIFLTSPSRTIQSTPLSLHILFHLLRFLYFIVISYIHPKVEVRYLGILSYAS